MSVEHHGHEGCWCDPDVHLICPACEPDPPDTEHETLEEALGAFAEAADEGCWRCGGEGLIDEDLDPWEIEEEAILTVHTKTRPPT